MFKKLQEIFKNGYVPDRGDETYKFTLPHRDPDMFSILKTGDLCNCLGHACFNLKNEHFEKYKINISDSRFFQGFIKDKETRENDVMAQKILNKIKAVGIIVSPAQNTEVLKNNQWRIAMYFDRIGIGSTNYLRDFHFIIQEKDKTWSGKDSWNFDVHKYDKLPEICDDYYKLYNVYTLTNPNAREK